MNIAITSSSLPPFDSIGAGVQNHYLANQFVKSGHDVTVFSPHDTAPNDALYKHIEVRLTGKLRTLKWAVSLSKIDFSSYDYLHCTGDDHYVKTSNKTCHLRQYHGNSLSEFKYARTPAAKLRNIMLYTTELLTGLRADILTCVSTRAATPLSSRTVVVPCGVDLGTFTPGGSKSLQPSVLFVGTLESRKRGDLLVDAFVSSVKVKFPAAVLNIVRETKPVGHQDIHVHGFVDQSKLVALYRSSWVFCLPSSYEGFGVPYIEAMGCGTAVVATANDGSLDVLENGKYGIVSSPASLGLDLVSLLSDSDRLRSLATLGLDRSKEYTWTSVVSKYISLVTGYHG
jgi:glycosyltransferase involved in cell wall biosynthesis